MDNNPEGTPNPLNPNPLDANPSEPIENKPTQPISQPITEELVEESITVESLDPEGRPMEKVAEAAPAPKKKKKTGLIIGMIICLFIAVGCGVAAILLMMNKESDPVVAAMKKLMNGDTPSNIMIDGDIEMTINEKSSPISKVSVNLGGQMKTNSPIRTVNTEMVLTFTDGSQTDFEVSEVYNEDGDIFFKAEGLSSVLEKMFSQSSTTEGEPVLDLDMLSGQNGFGDFEMLFGIIEVIDGEWLKISMDNYNEFVNNVTPTGDLSCMMDFVEKINKDSSSAIDLYNKNPFLSSTTEGININSKYNQVRQIAIDNTAFSNFINSVSNSELTKDLYDCVGLRGNLNVSEADVAEIMKQIPAVYVEIDKDNNFSRLYMEYATDNNEMTVVIDVAFSYPANINITEPEEYVPLEQMLQTVFMNMYDFDMNSFERFDENDLMDLYDYNMDLIEGLEDLNLQNLTF